MMKLMNTLSTTSVSRVRQLSAILIVLTGLVEYVTGNDVNISLLYLLPIALLAWFDSQHSALVAAAVCTALWIALEAGFWPEQIALAALVWNSAVRLTINLIAAIGFSTLRRTQRHERELVHLIIHDLRSPLANVLAGLHLLLMDNQMKEEDARTIRASIASCEQMSQLITSLLDLEMLKLGKLPLLIQPIIVDELIATAHQQVAGLAEYYNVKIVVSCDEDVTAIEADYQLMLRVLVNLLTNALKFSPFQSVITVRAFRENERFVVICISDQGPGIADENADHLFDTHVKLGGSPYRRHLPGSGLGLVFCRMATEAMGGRIWLDREQKQGTTMCIAFKAVADVA